MLLSVISVLLVVNIEFSIADIIDGLPVGPPMGFNPWSRFMCDINETLFTDTADAMVKNGMLDSGYNWVNLDDCWPNLERNDNGSLAWNETLFPKGFYYLGHYIKDRGLKFGIYSDAGNLTCGGYPGSLNHEEIDAETFQRWGIEYLKLDGCNVETWKGKSSEETYYAIYNKWHDIIKNNMTTPMIFSESAPAYFSGVDNLTDWYDIMDWVPKNGQLARHSYDVATYGPKSPWHSILTNYRENSLLARLQEPGYTNDPDFIIPDHPDLSLDEIKSHFGLWASMGAPLIVSAWIPDLDEEILDILNNKDLINVDQDKLALQATIVARNDSMEILSRYLENGDRLLTILNLEDVETSAHIPLEFVGYTNIDACCLHSKDLWTGVMQKIETHISVNNIAPHGTAIYRISGKGNIVPTGSIFNTRSQLCLDSSDSEQVKVVKCSSEEAQIWTVKGGVIKSLATGDQNCLGVNSAGKVSMQNCSGTDTQRWNYGVSGNIKNLKFGLCLTDNNGTLRARDCGYLTNEQVFEVPSGFLQFENSN